VPHALNQESLDQLFLKARTRNGWLDKPVAQGLLEAAWDLTRMGPTSANCCPMRIVFVTPDAAKARLKPHLMDGNVDKYWPPR